MEALLERPRICVDGLPSEATEDGLRDHFCKYGKVVRAVVTRDEASGEPKGYGFVWFADEGCAGAAVTDEEEQIILGTKVEVRRSTPREQSPARDSVPGETSRSYGDARGGRNCNRNPKKIFVGGLPHGLTTEEFRAFFEAFGEITDAVIIGHRETGKPRGFGFITFSSEESARVVLQKTWHRIGDKDVEVKPAIPKEEGSSRGSGRDGDYQYQPLIFPYQVYSQFVPMWQPPWGNPILFYLT